mmetsp:Transcript_6517/g.8795  ORF Transcript_6517/g.8795 Transcript_6517/m.8795 type:complete len:94 (+) Transcript_6517:707-988(+)
MGIVDRGKLLGALIEERVDHLVVRLGGLSFGAGHVTGLIMVVVVAVGTLVILTGELFEAACTHITMHKWMVRVHQTVSIKDAHLVVVRLRKHD